MILSPGIHQIAPEAYHADPCPRPGLSSSLAKILVGKTPLHAWTASVLNKDRVQKESDAFDIGRVCHAVLLGKGERYGVVAATDWTTKAAQQARADARARGLSPVLTHQHAASMRMAEIARERLARAKIELDQDRSEMTAIAEIDGVFCRILVDNAPEWPTLPLIDYKTCENASVDACNRTVRNLGYDIQWCFYREVWKAATGEDRRLWFLFQEKEAPYSCQLIDLYDVIGNEGDWLSDAKAKCAYAREMWRQCLESGVWPDYPDGVATLFAPTFFRNQWADRPVFSPTVAALDAAKKWQSPE